MPFTDEDRPDCLDGCGRKAALSKGELAYRGRCSKCYKDDVARRREEKQGGRVPERDVVRGAEAGGAGAAGAVPAGPAAVLPEEEEPGPRGRVRVPVKCGWCIDGNHEAREAEAPPAEDDPSSLTVRLRPASLGCAQDQTFLTGPMQGDSKGLKCACPRCAERRAAQEPATVGATEPHDQD